MSAFDEERKKLGLLTSNKNSTTSAFDNDRMDLGLIKDTRTKTEVKKAETKKVIPKTQAEANVNTKVSDTLKGKVPAASLITTPNSFGNNAITEFSDKVPAASLLTAGTGGPSDASHNFLKTEYDIREKAIDDTNMPEILKLPSRAINKLAFGTAPGRFISNSFSGNSGATQRDSTGSELADKASDVINNFVTPFITPTGAPIGAGPNMAPYEASSKLLNTKIGQQYTNYLSNSLINRGLVPKGSASAANTIARNTISETVAGPLQNVAAGLLNGQDSNQDIANNAQMGVGAGLGLGFGGAVAGELFSKVGPKLGRTPNTVDETLIRQGNKQTSANSQIGQNEVKVPMTREQEVFAKRIEDLTPDDIEFMINTEAKMPTPVEPTYIKPDVVTPPVEINDSTRGAYQRLLDATTEPTVNKQAPATVETPTKQPSLKESAESLKVEPKKNRTEIEEVEEAVKAANEPKIRDKVYSRLDEAEKAARERIAKRKANLNSNPLPEWIDYSIIMAAKLGKGTIKASNFTEVLVKDFGEDLRPHAEKILRMSREHIRKQERLASEEGLKAIEFNAKLEGDISSFSSKISRVKTKKKKSFSESWQQVRSQFSDDLAVVEDTEKKIRGGKLANAEDSLYKAARMFKGAPERASQIVQDRLSSVVTAVEKSGNSVEDLEMYALARHAQDVNKAGYKSGFTDQEIKSVLDEFGTPEMKAAQQELVKVNRDMLKELVDSGVVTRELYDVLGDRWENYIPLFRELDSEKVSFNGGVSQALANVTSPIKALQGSEKQVIAPLENMVKNIFQTVNAAERNKVALQIPKLAELDADGAFFRKMKPGEEVGQKNAVKVKVDGKDVFYDANPEVYKALLNLDKESSNTLINILSKPAALLRAGATLTPEFALRNPIRDINNAFVVSKSGFNPITDFGVGLIQTIKKGDLYKEWIDNLGSYGNTLSMDRNVHKKALETVLKQPKSKKFVNVVNGKWIIGLLRAISDTTESATKVGEYRAALRSGTSKQEAAYRSRDLMDFARAGSSIRPANKIVSFLNANIQGKSKLIRAIKENPGGVISRGFVSVTLPTIGIFIANHEFGNKVQKETIANAPDWMKDSFWLMAVPGTDIVARIPKPFDLASVFANLPEKALQFSFDKDPEAFEGFASRTIKSNALPTQISGLLPFIEGMANYSFFKDGAIIPKAEQGLEYKDQFDPIRTSSTARIIAGGVEKLNGGKGSLKNFASPRVVDNTLQGLTAGLGKYATDAIDVILDKVGVFERTAKPEKSIEQAPFTRSFLVDPNQGGKAMDKFYAMKDELTKEKASSKLNNKPFYEGEKIKEADGIDDLMKNINKSLRKVDKSFVKLNSKPFTKKDQLDMMNDVSDTMSAINKAIKSIERSDITSSQKRAQIEPLTKQRNELAKMSNDFFGVSK